MNKIEAKRVFSSILLLIKNEDPTNFERDYAENMTCTINSRELNLEELRQVIAGFVENFEVLELEIEDFIYENKKAIIRFFIKVRNKHDGKELEDHLFYVYHFEKKQLKKSWVLTTLPFIDKKLTA